MLRDRGIPVYIHLLFYSYLSDKLFALQVTVTGLMFWVRHFTARGMISCHSDERWRSSAIVRRWDGPRGECLPASVSEGWYTNTFLLRLSHRGPTGGFDSLKLWWYHQICFRIVSICYLKRLNTHGIYSSILFKRHNFGDFLLFPIHQAPFRKEDYSRRKSILSSQSNITKTRLFKYIEKFTSKNWKFTNKNKHWYFSHFCSKYSLWVLVRTASVRRFLRVPTIYVFEQK